LYLHFTLLDFNLLFYNWIDLKYSSDFIFNFFFFYLSCAGNTLGKRPRLDSNSHDSIPEQTTVPTNKNIRDILNILKPNIKLLAEDTNAVSRRY